MVEQTFANSYEGTLVEINVAGETIESTMTHPYWVIQGEGLENRPRPTHVEIVRPEGATTAGRWVDAQHLREGDELFLRDGRAVAIRSIKNRQFSGKVYNIKVADLECYTVGVNNVLVHNKAADDPSPVRGLAQGALNGLNGLTDMATDAANLSIKLGPLMAGPGGVANPLSWIWAYSAPQMKKYDWSYGMAAPEDKNLHNWSKFFWCFGLSIFAGEGLGALGESLDVDGTLNALGDYFGLNSDASAAVEDAASIIKERFGTAADDALAEFDSATGEISYNRSNIREEALATGTNWRQQLYVSAYHELGHRILNPVNNFVQYAFGLSRQPYFLSETCAVAEESAVELFGQVAARWRKEPGTPW
jgi:hypothetical protein